MPGVVSIPRHGASLRFSVLGLLDSLLLWREIEQLKGCQTNAVRLFYLVTHSKVHISAASKSIWLGREIVTLRVKVVYGSLLGVYGRQIKYPYSANTLRADRPRKGEIDRSS